MVNGALRSKLLVLRPDFQTKLLKIIFMVTLMLTPLFSFTLSLPFICTCLWPIPSCHFLLFKPRCPGRTWRRKWWMRRACQRRLRTRLGSTSVCRVRLPPNSHKMWDISGVLFLFHYIYLTAILTSYFADLRFYMQNIFSVYKYDAVLQMKICNISSSLKAILLWGMSFQTSVVHIHLHLPALTGVVTVHRPVTPLIQRSLCTHERKHFAVVYELQ